MSGNAKRDTDAGMETSTTFNIQVCSKDGQLLSEYTLNRHQHDVTTLGAAEQRAEENLLENYGEALVVIVSEETLTKLRQTQRIVTPIANAANCVRASS
jgi:hypothetical protein